jgi:AcrR family transcriptional regulator
MTRARDRWLDLGLDVLATEGPSALRIDPLAARLGLSKGSFFHHFASAAAFRSAASSTRVISTGSACQAL